MTSMWDFLFLRVADFGVHAVGARVYLYAQASFFILPGDFVSKFHMAVGDGDDGNLHGGKPGGESTGVMLDEHAKEAFHGTQQRAVYHIRAVLLTVFADVTMSKRSGSLKSN